MSNQRDSLRINREDKRFLGVCAGLADYLDLPVVLIRIIFVISVLTWPTLLLVYFVVYYCLDKNITTDKIYNFVSDSNPTEHLRNLNYSRPIFRNMRNRRIAGVCSGIAEYLEIRPFYVRVMALVSLFIMGPFAVLAYAVAWFVMEPNPARRHYDSHRENRKRRRGQRRAYRQMHKHWGFASSRINDEEADRAEQEHSTQTQQRRDSQFNPDETVDISSRFDRSQTLEACADLYYSLESRMREIEAFMTSKRFRLHCEINRI